MTEILGCTAATCIDTATAAYLFSIVLGCFGLGYGVGHLVLWTRRIYEVS